MKIEEVTIHHLPILASLFNGYMQFYQQADDIDRYNQFLYDRIENNEAKIFMAVDEIGVGAGFTLLYPSFSSVSQASIYILNDLFVHPNYRNQGVASQLMAAAARWAKDKGAVRLHLETEDTNKPAQRLYENEGWTKDFSFYHYSLKL